MTRSLYLHFCEAVENTLCGFRFPPLRQPVYSRSALSRSNPGLNWWWFVDRSPEGPVHALDHLLRDTTVREMGGPVLSVPITHFLFLSRLR